MASNENTEMSDHIPDATKMIGDTPRTNNYDWSFHLLFAEAQKMERELNAANERIRRLEEAGDAMVSHAKALGMDGTGLVKRWLKAKEAKP
jgi:hypothetical protein